MGLTVLETPRLILRPWREADHAPFAALNADPRVMEYFPACLSSDESNALAQRIQDKINNNGWGFWAVERQTDRRFLGFVGLNSPPAELPFSPCVEVGWRLVCDAWGQGYAVEAAHRSLQFGFDELALNAIVAFTARPNLRSQRVMQKLGMSTRIGDNFLHPSVAPDHSLALHVLYQLSREDFALTRKTNDAL